MDRVRQVLILLMVAAMPAAALPPPVAYVPPLCLTVGATTYRLTPTVGSADYRVHIENSAAHPDLRIGLVDDAASADFALVDDDTGVSRNGCSSTGSLKSVAIVSATESADTTIRLTRAQQEADFHLFLHSTRVNEEDAAALLALMQHADSTPQRVTSR